MYYNGLIDAKLLMDSYKYNSGPRQRGGGHLADSVDSHHRWTAGSYIVLRAVGY